jgi:hypothetical protein
MNKKIKCYGCGAPVEDIEGPVHRYVGAPAGCWKIFTEVLAKEYSDYILLEQTHRLTVDAYAVQHPGKPSRQAIQSVNVHLMRLYLGLEKNITGKEANDAMKKIAGRKHNFTWLTPPELNGTITVIDVSKAGSLEEHKRLVKKWARSVWDAWKEHHEKVTNNLKLYNIIK